MSLGTCTRCKEAPATWQDDLLSANRFCKACEAKYLAEFDDMANKAPRPNPDNYDRSAEKRGFGRPPPPDNPRLCVAEASKDPKTSHKHASWDVLSMGMDMKKNSERAADDLNISDGFNTPDYFDCATFSQFDIMLKMAIGQGYVPETCLLAGPVVMSEVYAGRDPCAGCHGPRDRCGGRPYRDGP